MVLLLLGGAYVFTPDRFSVASKEAYAVDRLRRVARSQEEFRKLHWSFADSLDSLQDLGVAKSDYVYVLEVTARDEGGHPAGYVVKASPRVRNRTGVRSFSVDETGALRWDANQITPQSPLLEPLLK
jgi:hypothetical protein